MAKFTDLNLNGAKDIAVVGKDLELILSFEDQVAQRLSIRLKFFKGEWFLNTLFGIPFHQRIFTKEITPAQVDGIFRTAIISTPGVIEILTFTSTLDVSSREYTLKFSCRVTTGEIIILEV